MSKLVPQAILTQIKRRKTVKPVSPLDDVTAHFNALLKSQSLLKSNAHDQSKHKCKQTCTHIHQTVSFEKLVHSIPPLLKTTTTTTTTTTNIQG